jgi:xylulokinase
VATPFTSSAAGIDMAVADLERALHEVIAALGPAPEPVAAVGVTGMAESGAPFRSGRPVGPIIAWHDGRGEETVAALDQRFGPVLARWTGRRLRTVSSLAKLGWLLDHGVPVPDRWLGVPELVLFLLTGAEGTEHSLAARTGAYHVIDRRFLPDVISPVLAQRGDPSLTPADLFPPVRAAGTPMGAVSRAAASAYGLPAGIPVTIAGHDHLAAAAGLGAAAGDLLNSVGTAETLLRRVGTAPDVDRAVELDLAVTVWPGGDAWCVLASAVRSGVVLGDLAASLGRSPAELDRLAAAFLTGGPADLADSGAAAGADGDAGRAWAGALAELAGRTVAAAARVAALVGPHDRLIVFGGGSRSRPWVTAKAALAGVPVLRTTVAEAAARGAALAAGSAAGWWPAARGPVPALEPVNPPRRQ